MNTETLLRVKQADPWPEDRPTPEGVWHALQALDEIVTRTTQKRAEPTGPIGSGLVVAVVAAVVVLVLIGGFALLINNSGETQPAVTVVTTLVEITPSTVAESAPPTTVASPNPTLAAKPVPPPGEGPQLEFAPVEVPGGWLGDGVWFQGALYAISDGELFRSSDGFTWELLPGPPGIANLESDFQGLEAGGGLLVYAGVDGAVGGECSLPGDAIVVNTSNNGVDWKTSRVELPIPDSGFPFGCYRGRWDRLAAGPQGIMITALVDGEISPESIFEAEFGLGLDPVRMSIGDGFIEVTTADGEVYEIDLEAAGYLDDIETWLGDASDDPNFAELALERRGPPEKGYAWFSPDGQTWSQLDASGPTAGGGIQNVVATSDGFVATSTGGMWETTDGTTWIQKSTLSDSRLSDPYPYGLGVWDGRLVAATWNGVWTIEDTPQELVASDEISDFGVIQIGEFGLVGMRSEMQGGGTEVLFSANGTTWNRWTPPEFGPEGTVYVVGIGDDFVVLRVLTEAGISHWVGRLP